MPNIASAAKRMRSDVKKGFRNQKTLSELHTLSKRLTTLAQSKAKETKEVAKLLISKLDKAVSHGIIPHGRADRKKARIGKLLKKS